MLDAETKRRIDNARDVLVGKVPDPKTQVEQITFAMIYKFMDDMDQLSVSIGGKPSFFTNGYEQYAWSKLLDKRMGGEARLDLYVRALDQMSQNPHIPQLFRDIFKGAFLPYRDSETLNLFLKEMNGFQYIHSEDLGDAYEYLLAVFASQGKAGQFRTPRHIIDFIVDCVNPSKDDTVLDPACGTAGFLISAYKHILEAHAQDPLSPDEKKRLTENFVGYDISPDMVRLSRVNMYLHQFPNPTIHEYDTLTNEDRWDDNFDVILANPPFMTPKGGIRPHKRFAVRANRSEVLFVDYIAEHLNPGGRAGVIVPEGIIFQSNNAYKALRKMLVEDGYLVAVVSLPQGVFNPYSSVKTSILIIDKTRANKTDSIMFGKVSNDGFDLGATRRKSGAGDLPDLSTALKDWFNEIDSNSGKEDPGMHDNRCLWVKKSQISIGGEYRLSAEFYKDQNVGRNNEISWVRLGSILKETSQEKVKGEQNLPILSMTMKSGLIDQTEKFSKRIASKDISGYKKVYRGQLVEGFPVDEGVLAIQRKYDCAAVSPAYKVWDVNDGIVDPLFLELILRSDNARSIYRSLMQGTAGRRRTLQKEIFLNIEIPVPNLAYQISLIDEIKSYQNVIDGARQIVENYKPIIPIDPSWSIVKLGDVINTVTPPKKIQKHDYLTEGSIPIIDQGKELIAGWTEDENAIIHVDDPVVIFGDHTCAFKYVEFPFVQGADGIKVLVSNQQLTPKYLYYALMNKRIKPDGYKRHFSKLTELDIPLPPLEIQKQLVKELDELQSLVDFNKQIVTRLEANINAQIKSVWDGV